MTRTCSKVAFVALILSASLASSVLQLFAASDMNNELAGDEAWLRVIADYDALDVALGKRHEVELARITDDLCESIGKLPTSGEWIYVRNVSSAFVNRLAYAGKQDLAIRLAGATFPQMKGHITSIRSTPPAESPLTRTKQFLANYKWNAANSVQASTDLLTRINAWLDAGQMCGLAGVYQDAEKCYEEAVRESRGTEKVYDAYGKLYELAVQLRQRDKAAGVIKRIQADLDSNVSPDLAGIGRTAAYGGYVDQAVELFVLAAKAATKKAGTHASKQAAVGSALDFAANPAAVLKRPDLVTEVCERFIAEEKKSATHDLDLASSLLECSRVLLKNDQNQLSRERFAQAIELLKDRPIASEDSSKSLENLADLFLAAKMDKEAQTSLATVVSLRLAAKSNPLTIARDYARLAEQQSACGDSKAAESSMKASFGYADEATAFGGAWVREYKALSRDAAPSRLVSILNAGRKQIQSVDFGPYIADLERRIRRHWLPTASQHKPIFVLFSIQGDGTLVGLRLDTSSGDQVLDAAAIKAVQESAPFHPLPLGIGRLPEVVCSFIDNRSAFSPSIRFRDM